MYFFGAGLIIGMAFIVFIVAPNYINLDPAFLLSYLLPAIAFGLLFIFFGRALWRNKPWTRIVALIISIIILISATFFSIFMIGQIIFESIAPILSASVLFVLCLRNFQNKKPKEKYIQVIGIMDSSLFALPNRSFLLPLLIR